MTAFGLRPFGVELGSLGGVGLVTVHGVLPEGRGSLVVVFDRPISASDSALWYSANNPANFVLLAIDPTVDVGGTPVVPRGKVAPTHAVATANVTRDAADHTQVVVQSDTAFERGVTYQVTLSPSLRGEAGETFAGDRVFEFVAPGSPAQTSVPRAAIERFRDLRNRFLPDPKSPGSSGGTFAISSGDVEVCDAKESLRKRLLRGVMTTRGGFAFPGYETYGLMPPMGRLLTRGTLAQIASAAPEQARQEPEVVAAAADVTASPTDPGAVTIRVYALTRDKGEPTVVTVERPLPQDSTVADTLTHSDLFQAGRREVVLSPTRFDPAIVDVRGSDVNILANLSAAIGEETFAWVVQAVLDLHLSTARGDALERLVYDLYGISKKRANSSVVTLTLTRSGTDPITVDKGSTFSTTTGVSFVTEVDAAFGTGNRGPIYVIATAQVSGTGGRVLAGEVTIVTTPLDDPTVLVTNDEASAGGDDDETDDDLRKRARQFFPTARRGTQAAIEFGALSVDRVAQALAVELTSPETTFPGYRVRLTVADVEGHANSAVVQAVLDALIEYRALGVPVNVIGGVPQYVDILVEGLSFTAGANTQAVLADARARIVAMVNALAPGETLLRNAIRSILGQVQQLIVPDGAVVEPAGDLVPAVGSVIRTTAGRVELNP